MQVPVKARGIGSLVVSVTGSCELPNMSDWEMKFQSSARAACTLNC